MLIKHLLCTKLHVLGLQYWTRPSSIPMEPTFIGVSSQGVKARVPCSWSQCSPNTLQILLRNYLFVCIQYVVLGLKSGQLCQPRHTSVFPNTLPMLLQSMHTHFECLKRRHCDCEEEITLVMNENWGMTWTTPLLHTPPSLVPTQPEAHDLDGVPASKLLNCLVQVHH